MANSLIFNGANLAQYNLYVIKSNVPVDTEVAFQQLDYKSYGNDSIIIPKRLIFGVSVTAVTLAALKSNLDNVKRVLFSRIDGQLQYHPSLPDRYWNARFEGLTGELEGVLSWRGEALFTCLDPYAYSIQEYEVEDDVDEDPKIIIVNNEGAVETEPVYALTAGEDLAGITITLTNLTTTKALSWQGSLDSADILEVDAPHWHVTKNDISDISTISGQFPTLVAGYNHIQIEEFGVLGSVKITYRRRFV